MRFYKYPHIEKQRKRAKFSHESGNEREAMKIGRRGIGVMMMMMLFYSVMATSSSLQNASPSGSHYQETDQSKKKGITDQIGARYSGIGSHGGGGEGGGEGHTSPHTGGSAVIPIYAAGSAHHGRGRHSSAGNRNQNNLVLLAAAVLAVTVLLCVQN